MLFAIRFPILPNPAVIRIARMPTDRPKSPLHIPLQDGDKSEGKTLLSPKDGILDIYIGIKPQTFRRLSYTMYEKYL